MTPKPKSIDPVIRKLEEINAVLKDLLILECARSGIGKAEVRRIVGVADSKVTRIWKRLGDKAEA